MIDIIQQFNGFESSIFENPPIKYNIDNVDKLNSILTKRFSIDCRQKEFLTIKYDDYAYLLYNELDNKYFGVYETTEDTYDFFRSVPDYINSIFSQPHALLLLATYRTYVSDNDLSIDDGIDFEIINDIWGPNIDRCLYITTPGFHGHIASKIEDEHKTILAKRLGVPVNEVKDEHSGLNQGGYKAIPW